VVIGTMRVVLAFEIRHLPDDIDKARAASIGRAAAT
jgi:hypothetical protein